MAAGVRGVRAADRGGLSSDDLERLAEAAWWSAHPTESIDAFERAYAAFSAEGKTRAAPGVGLRLAMEYADRLDSAVWNGWLQRASGCWRTSRSASSTGGSSSAWSVRRSSGRDRGGGAARGRRPGDRRAVRRPGPRGVRPGAAGRDPRLRTAARAGAGSLVDEATLAAVGGELTPTSPGTSTASRSASAGASPTTGGRRSGPRRPRAGANASRSPASRASAACSGPRSCGSTVRYERGRGRGQQGADRARGVRPAPAGGGGRERGGRGASAPRRSRRRRGGVRAGPPPRARAAAGDRVAPPRAGPGRRGAVVDRHGARRRGGPVRPGAAAARRASRSPSPRYDVADAREAAEELAEIAAAIDAPMLHAAAHQALGCRAHRRGAARPPRSPSSARPSGAGPRPTRRSRRRRPASLARGRVPLGRRRGVGAPRAPRRPRMRSNASAPCWRRGAVRGDDPRRRGSRRRTPRVVRTFMFTDIVGSTTWSRRSATRRGRTILRWHDETLRALIEQHRGEVVHTTGDGFFASFPDASAAASCAVAIQRRLAEHRRKHGFAPRVRIGLHAAEATMIADDYAGLGVHEAARVGAIAEGGEILATASTSRREAIPFDVGGRARGLAQGARAAGSRGRDRVAGLATRGRGRFDIVFDIICT